MVAQGKSERYVTNRRGWRGGKRSLAHQAKCIIDSMQAHDRPLDYYKPSDELRAIIEQRLGEQAKKAAATAKTMALSDEQLAGIAVHIVRATMRKGGNPRLAVEPYSDAVRRHMAVELTHSECKACGIIGANAPDCVELYLRTKAQKIENERYVALGYLSLA